MPDVLSLTYSDIKTVKTRGVFQLVLEAPIEAMPGAFALLGAPVPGNEVWVAVARLRSKPEALTALESVEVEDEPIQIPQQRSLSQIAGLLCTKVAFRKFLGELCGGITFNDPEVAAMEVRRRCGVTSRKELDTDETAARHFRNLRDKYDLWMRGEAA